MAELEVHSLEVHHTVSGIALSMARSTKFEGIKEHSPRLLAYISVGCHFRHVLVRYNGPTAA